MAPRWTIGLGVVQIVLALATGAGALWVCDYVGTLNFAGMLSAGMAAQPAAPAPRPVEVNPHAATLPADDEVIDFNRMLNPVLVWQDGGPPTTTRPATRPRPSAAAEPPRGSADTLGVRFGVGETVRYAWLVVAELTAGWMLIAGIAMVFRARRGRRWSAAAGWLVLIATILTMVGITLLITDGLFPPLPPLTYALIAAVPGACGIALILAARRPDWRAYRRSDRRPAT